MVKTWGLALVAWTSLVSYRGLVKVLPPKSIMNLSPVWVTFRPIVREKLAPWLPLTRAKPGWA